MQPQTRSAARPELLQPEPDSSDRLTRGDLLPRMVAAPPGPRARSYAHRIAAADAGGLDLERGPGSRILLLEALGSNVLDVDGNRYVDLTSGFGAALVGHRHPHVVAALRRQSERMIHALGDVYYHPARVELAERLCSLVPVDDPRVRFAVSGSDAIEVALKTALLATGRDRLLAFEGWYHGSTMGALALTSRAAFRRPFAGHLSPHVGRLAFGCPPASLEAALAGDDVAAVLVEPVIGREGGIFPPPGWLTELAAACRRHGTLLVADEIFTGFGRLGHRFAVDAESVRPDLLCCGKAMAGGLPVAAVAGRRSLMAVWSEPGEPVHSATFVGHPLACAAALAAIEVIETEGLARRSAELGELMERCRSWTDRRTAAGAPAVTAVRGRGLLWALEAASSDLAARWTAAALERGVLVLAGGPDGRALRVDPALTITREQLSAAIDVLEEALLAACAAG